MTRCRRGVVGIDSSKSSGIPWNQLLWGGRGNTLLVGIYPRGWSISVVIMASEDGRENANS